MSEDFYAYRARVLGRLDTHVRECRWARLAREQEAAKRAAQLELIADEDIERAAIAAE